jgi:hypothetical protein
MSAMSNARQKFDPLELEIVERVYEVGCAYLAARGLYEDAAIHAEEEVMLRKAVFSSIGTEHLDFDALCDSVISQIETIRALARAVSLSRSGPTPETPAPRVAVARGLNQTRN